MTAEDARILVLSLFPGIGLLDLAFEEQGFCVVRGPDLLWGGDIKRFHPPVGKFNGIIGGPPCQAFSSLQHLVAHMRKKHPGKYKKAENLIPEFERCVWEAKPEWFLMENVKDAPVPSVEGYFVTPRLVNNRWVGGIQNRLRRFSFGHWVKHVSEAFELPGNALEPAEWLPVILTDSRSTPVKIGGGGKSKRSLHCGKRFSIAKICKAQGLPETHLEHSPFTAMGKRKALGNGVPLPLGRAVAKAVVDALNDAKRLTDIRAGTG